MAGKKKMPTASELIGMKRSLIRENHIDFCKKLAAAPKAVVRLYRLLERRSKLVIWRCANKGKMADVLLFFQGDSSKYTLAEVRSAVGLLNHPANNWMVKIRRKKSSGHRKQSVWQVTIPVE